ncbi:hypothetical protein BDP27DRAFT_1427733 [Rhodocollybia butyracea]|uniref:SET domain-containing protein n=1 Tax=Rhodocollybia butyracea TaxID=206335 RepID=A0A9P5U0H3_9AGAR|nr:hypothetical protein BDP27DRAFT_1427733 [Rhodocollybia butyracea]
MRRGFLATSKAKERIDKAVSDSNTPVLPKFTELSHGVVPEAGVPKDYKPDFDHEYNEFSADTLNYPKKVAVYTSIPARGCNDKPSDIPGGWAECFIPGELKRELYSTPGFPRVPLAPTGGKAYCIKELEEPGRNDLGLFATRLIHAGDLVVDERPMLVVSGGSNVPLPESIASYMAEQLRQVTTLEQLKQVIFHGWGTLVKTAFDRMADEYKEEFMALANSHEHDGSDEIVGRIRTNGIQALDGAGSAVCKDISRVNHSCGPNTSFSWHTESFSVQLIAVRDIPPNTEITISYCNKLAPASERATTLAPYEISSCICTDTGLSCFDPARSKIGDARRAKFAQDIIALTPPFEKPPPGTPKDAWVQPALRRFRELEEEGLEGTEYYQKTAHQLMNVYTFLQDMEKTLFYAGKLKGVYKFYEKKELDMMYFNEEEIRESPMWTMGNLHKMGAPVFVSFAPLE